jgi:hypothetical protein
VTGKTKEGEAKSGKQSQNGKVKARPAFAFPATRHLSHVSSLPLPFLPRNFSDTSQNNVRPANS